ncbi:MAG: carboxypeptidase regulatory-like domain-containing protein [Chloroflexi bacterium]|nr:carboxypeptidase regulatory-like domain-containing protein [Chloroflexota bacterium]
MSPINKPHPTDAELLAHLDEAEPEVAAHLEGCHDCRERAERLRRLERQLAAKLDRADCPSSLELGEFHLRVLPSEREASVARHLAECPRCRREVAQLVAYQAQAPLAPEPGLLDRLFEGARVLWARRVSRATAAALAPAYRGAEAAAPAIYQAEEARLIIEAEPDPARPGRFVVTGLVTGAEALGAAEVQLWLAGEPAGRAPVGEVGDFALEGLAAGSYTLVLAAPGAEIRVRNLVVGA